MLRYFLSMKRVFDRLFSASKQGMGALQMSDASGVVAKERLQIILSRQRASARLSNVDIRKLQSELLKAVRQYIPVETDEVVISVRKDGSLDVFEMQVAISGQPHEVAGPSATPESILQQSAASLLSADPLRTAAAAPAPVVSGTGAAGENRAALPISAEKPEPLSEDGKQSTKRPRRTSGRASVQTNP